MKEVFLKKEFRKTEILLVFSLEGENTVKFKGLNCVLVMEMEVFRI